MTNMSNFTPDEWKVLLESVMAAGIAITAAEPSGLWGLLKESFAGGSEAGEGQDRSRDQCAHQSSCRRFEYDRRKRSARRTEEQVQE